MGERRNWPTVNSLKLRFPLLTKGMALSRISGEVSTSSRPSAILGGAFQPPSSAFGESPILTPRPTSSSSSRSSYSPPSQSPLLGRGGPPQGGPPYPHASHQSPLPPRHGAASSDGSVYSPSSSPLQVRPQEVLLSARFLIFELYR